MHAAWMRKNGIQRAMQSGLPHGLIWSVRSGQLPREAHHTHMYTFGLVYGQAGSVAHRATKE